MTWSSPHTYVTNEIVTSSMLNTDHRDNLLAMLHPYDYASSDLDVANTVSETSLWSKVVTGAALGTSGRMVAEITGDYLFNNAAADTATIRVKFGGSTVMTHTFGAYAATGGSGRYHWRLLVVVANKGATNSQEVSTVSFWHNHQFVSSASATGTAQASSISHGSNYTAVDTTADQTFQVTAQWSAASANLSWRKRVAVLLLGQN